jgi:tryptophanyl-tRNA synthetase
VYPQTLLCTPPLNPKTHKTMLTCSAPAKRIMSLTNPLKKMSKSDPSPLSRILITDSPSLIQRKLTTAVTDSLNSVSYDPINRPGVSNLLSLLSAFDKENRTPEELGKVYGTGMGLGAFKKLVGEAIADGLESFRGRYEEVVKEGEGFIGEVERRGAKVAEENAESTMVGVREAVGL